MTPDRRSATDARVRQLRALIERCATNPFFSPKLAAAGLDPESIESLDVLRRLEPMDKSEVLHDQDSAPPFGTRLGVPAESVREVHLTSGTSGLGQEAMALTDTDVDASGRTWVPAFRSAGLGAGALLATFYPATIFAYGRSIASGSRITGVPVVSLAGLDRELALQLIRRLQPAAIGARPALFTLLEESLASHGTNPAEALPSLRGLIASGLTVEQTQAMEQTWDVTVHEVYGMSQAAGPIAVTGPEGAAPLGERGVMWCNEDLFIVEAVDPVTLEPVVEGEAELLLTCLERVASPVIRFRTRDRVDVVREEGDPCGRVGIRVGSIGRWDDMIKLRGNNVWPGQLDEALLAAPGVADYLAEVRTDERGVEQLVVTVRRDASEVSGSDLASDLARRVKTTTNVRPSVLFDDALPEPDLKPKRLIDRRHQ